MKITRILSVASLSTSATETPSEAADSQAVITIALDREIVRRVLLAVSALVLGVLSVHVLSILCILAYSLLQGRG